MLVNPSSLYGGFAQRVDTTAAANFFLKQQAKEEAQSAALDKYYRNLTAKATDKGVRSEEQEILAAAVDDYKNFYIKNSKVLANNRNPAITAEAERLARIPFEIAAASRDAYAVDNKVGAARIAQPKLDKLWTEGTWARYNQHTAPTHYKDANGHIVRNPQHADFNPALIETHPEEVDLNKQWDQAGSGAKEEKIESGPAVKHPTKPFTQVQPISYSVNASNLATVGNNARAQWNDGTEYTFKKLMDLDAIKKDPAKFKILQTSYEKAYPGYTIETPVDLYVAVAINRKDITRTDQENVRDEIGYAKFMNDLRVQSSKKLIDYNKDAKAVAANNNIRTSFEDFVPGVYNNGKIKIENGIVYDVQTGKRYTSNKNFDLTVGKDAIPRKLISKLPADMQVAVDYMELTVKDGIIQGAMNELTGYIPRTDVVKEAQKDAGVKPATIKLDPLGLDL
jgi:hypothetical protein